MKKKNMFNLSFIKSICFNAEAVYNFKIIEQIDHLIRTRHVYRVFGVISPNFSDKHNTHIRSCRMKYS